MRLDVTGEVLKDEKLFEKYRYRFDFPADTKADTLPVVIDRILPKGVYTFRVKIADAESHAEAIVEKEVEVPGVEGRELAGARAAEKGRSTELRIIPLPTEI